MKVSIVMRHSLTFLGMTCILNLKKNYSKEGELQRFDWNIIPSCRLFMKLSSLFSILL